LAHYALSPVFKKTQLTTTDVATCNLQLYRSNKSIDIPVVG
jgi:hypothetical protein